MEYSRRGKIKNFAINALIGASLGTRACEILLANRFSASGARGISRWWSEA
jgi:hypothetical protein